MNRKRVIFAKKYKSLSPKQWDNVLFSDESIFQASVSEGGRRVRRIRGQGRYEEKYTKRTIKNPPSQMIWTSFSSLGTGEIYFLKPGQRMTAILFTEVVLSHLIPTMKKLKVSSFIQDNATCHTAKKSRDILKKNIKTVYLPPSSPDLNPIENAFAILKSKIENEDIKTLPKLRTAIRKIWKSMNKKHLSNLARSMPKRLRRVLELGGAMTEY